MTAKRPDRFFHVLLPLMLAGLTFGVYQLLELRLQMGDVYPAYSSLRTDPLGTKVLFDALSQIKSVSVDRNYGPVEKLDQPMEAILLDLGEDREEVLNIPESRGKGLEAKILQGARVVIGFTGLNNAKEKNKGLGLFSGSEPTPSPTVVPSPTPNQSGSGKRPPEPKAVPIREMGDLWGVRAGSEVLPQKSTKGFVTQENRYQPVVVVREGPPVIPSALWWHSSEYFEGLDAAWKVLYRRGTHPVAIERRMGKGSLVLLTDSYLLSNEAMQKNLYPDLLVYLIGDKKNVVFDETHLGVYESPNTATLAKKYGLQGFLLGLLVLAGLFIWRNSLSLVPPAGQSAPWEAAEQSGKNQSAGLMNLLKRNIPEGEILKVCFEQWKKSVDKGGASLSRRVLEMEKELEGLRAGKGKGPAPVSGRSVPPEEGYLRLARILNKRR